MVGIFSNNNNDEGNSNHSISELNITTPIVGSTTSSGETNNTVLGIFVSLVSCLIHIVSVSLMCTL